MKTLYIECNMGAAGDMIMSSLLELYDNQEAFFTKMNSLIPNVNLKEQLKKCCGIVGTHISVDVDGVEENEHMYDHHEHHHA